MKYTNHILILALTILAIACGGNKDNNNNNNGCPANYTFVADGTTNTAYNPYGQQGYNPYGQQGYNPYGSYNPYGNTYGNTQGTIRSTNNNGYCIATTAVQSNTQYSPCSYNGGTNNGVLVNNQCMDPSQVAATPNGQYPYGGYNPYGGYGNYGYPNNNYYYRQGSWGPFNYYYGYPRW